MSNIITISIEILKKYNISIGNNPLQTLREFEDNVNWGYISRYQKLSEEFIREFEDKVGWGRISGYQRFYKKNNYLEDKRTVIKED